MHLVVVRISVKITILVAPWCETPPPQCSPWGQSLVCHLVKGLAFLMEIALPMWLQLNSTLICPYHIIKLYVFEDLSFLAPCHLLAQFTYQGTIPRLLVYTAQFLSCLLDSADEWLQRWKLFLDQGC